LNWTLGALVAVALAFVGTPFLGTPFAATPATLAPFSAAGDFPEPSGDGQTEPNSDGQSGPNGPDTGVPSSPAFESARPTLKGKAEVGRELRVDTGAWATGTTFDYKWLRDGKAIKGATQPSYWLTSKDLGKKVSVALTGHSPAGEAKTEASSAKEVADSRTGDKLTKPFTVKGVLVISKEHRVARQYLKKGTGHMGSTEDAGDAFERMRQAAKEAGHSIAASSGYRSFDSQTTIWKRNVRALGQERGEQMAAPPGSSEHNAGLAFDLYSGGNRQYRFGASEAGKWVAQNAWKYGFIMRYPEGKTDITGFAHEPWHFRYIGVEHSKAFAENPTLTLEEYLGLA
jgi:D-alanyl-D-alanine carboxypeptidase